MINVSEGRTLDFPSVTITTENYSVVIIPSIGGRIMEFGADGINLLYQNESLAGYHPHYDVQNAEEMRLLRVHGQILLYGGEKTWLAPQSEWGACPYADLDHGNYQWEVQQSDQVVTLVLTSPLCRETQLRIVRTITCASGMRYIDIEHKLINHGTVPVTKGLWQVTMLNRDGNVDIPDGPTVRAERPLPLLNEHLASVKKHSHSWQMDLNNDSIFKLGFMTDAGRTTAQYQAANGKTYMLTKTFSVEPHQAYPHNTVVEVYNASEYPYFELEVHSPSYTLQPDGCATFTTRWELTVN